MPLTNLAAGPMDKLGQVPGFNSIGTAAGEFSKIRKRFLSVSKNPRKSGNGLTDYDDPTYLGFTLVFDRLSPLFNGATAGQPGGVAAGQAREQHSAIGYLKAIGETTRASYLQAFVQGMLEINTNRPYYWQVITGLDEAWKSITAMGPDPYIGSKDRDGIAISCLEAVDLKLTALFSLYKLAVYDNAYRRMVVPNNLLHFNVDVQVAEIRQFQKTLNYLGIVSGRGNVGGDADAVIAANSSFVTFRFSDCKWIAEESGKVFDSVSNAGGEVVSSSIKWSYANVGIDAEFAGYDSALLDSRQQPAGTIAQFAKEQAQQVAQQALASAANRAEGAVLAQTNRLIFGNVHGGVQNSIAGILQNPGGALTNAAIGGVAGTSGRGSAADDAPIRISDTIMPETVPPKTTITDEPVHQSVVQDSTLAPATVFGPAPSGPPPLTSTNVHG